MVRHALFAWCSLIAFGAFLRHLFFACTSAVLAAESHSITLSGLCPHKKKLAFAVYFGRPCYSSKLSSPFISLCVVPGQAVALWQAQWLHFKYMPCRH